jgi:hypothetical protein
MTQPFLPARRLFSAAFLPVLLATRALAHPSVEAIAVIEQDDVVEASGLARSGIDSEILWVLNDGGSDPRLYATDETGKHRGRLTLDPAKNRDWEDLASFTLDGVPYLLVGDIGDNSARHDTSILYIVEEPDLDDDDKVRSEPAWTVEFRYPDGPRDAESLAVDAEEGRVYILTKRSIPPELYSVPLRGSDGVVTAEKHGMHTSLPAPRRIDVELAPKLKDWFWQPTAMDFSDDGRLAAVMTYRGIYIYRRIPGEPWLDALNRPPARISLGGYVGAESVALSADGSAVYATIERRHPPLLKASPIPAPKHSGPPPGR